ncbi:MAG: hypothetical protein C0631_17850 [Sedimenticola sp.]|nr:MAG: hypothetical protein C0631_17850 [Sedimenticola sp.]
MKIYFPYILLFVSTSIASENRHYVTDIHQSEWSIKNSAGICILSHKIADFATAEYQLKRFRKLRLSIESTPADVTTTGVFLKQTAPSWMHDGSVSPLLDHRLEKQQYPIIIEGEPALRSIEVLKHGYYVTLEYQQSKFADSQIQVSLNPIQFQKAYRDFELCKSNLVDYSFDDVRHTELNFSTNVFTLNDKMKQQIDRIVDHILSTKGRYRVKVSGHTDSIARRRYNAGLSQRRAQSVANYMALKGISSQVITTHALGEQQPKRSNDTEQGRRENRRVEIELVLLAPE